MIFTSYTYLLFLIAAFVIHWASPARTRKALLVAASYVFYATWDWRFAFLLLGLSLFNWRYALWLRHARWEWALGLGISINLGALVYFKYTNFILVNMSEVARSFGSAWQPALADIVLPLGISFFTFQGVAYLFDVATGEEPLAKVQDFLLFKALWPQLIAGPIIRLSEIRSQIIGERRIGYDDIAYGSRRILFGFFKKVVFADNLGTYIDAVFSSAASPHMIDGVAAAIGFGLEIYFDFSAYSDIAIGSARLFGFVFPENFNWPYAATSPRAFWNRWHMTLSRWIRDYVYTPLAFAKRHHPRFAPIWLLIAMALCGLWHGAQWTFVVWGAWHGLLLATQQAMPRLFPSDERTAHGGRVVLGSVVTIACVFASWLVFRSPSLSYAWTLIAGILTMQGGLRPAILRENVIVFIGLLFMGVVAARAIASARKQYQSTLVFHFSRVVRPALYAAMVLAIVIFDQSSRAFIYFQF